MFCAFVCSHEKRGSEVGKVPLYYYTFSPYPKMQRIQIIWMICMCLAVSIPMASAQPADSLLTALLNSPVSVAESEAALARTRSAHLTVLTSEDLVAFGITTLAEAVQQLAGIYVAYDHAYAYLGVRGLGLTSDYNSRLIVAIDGVSTKEFVFGSSLTERGLGIPLSAIERIEVVRGPGTLDYGSGSMVMVINIVTRSSARMPGLGAQLRADQFRALDGHLTLTHKTDRSDLVVIGQGFHAPGRTYTFNHDIAGPYSSSFDLEEALGFFARYQRDRTLVSVLHSRRSKDVPTAPFETNIDSPTVQRDQTTQVRVRHSIPVRDRLGLNTEASAHWYDFSGLYPYTDEDGLPYVSEDFGHAARYTASAEALYATPLGNTWTVKTSFVHHPSISYRTENMGEDDQRDRTSMSVVSATLLGERQLWPRLMARAGAQLEWNSLAKDTRLAPELGLVYALSDRAMFRLLYAHTYRLPSFYESLQANSAAHLVAETGHAFEATASAALSEHVRLEAGAYVSRFYNLIRARLDEASMDVYDNTTDVTLRGIEVSLNRRQGHTSYIYANYAWSAPAVTRGAPLPNSPRHLARAGGWMRWNPIRLGSHWRLEGPRTTRMGSDTPTYLLGDVKASVELNRFATLHLTLSNVLNTPYVHPGGHDHLLNTIPQPGRTAGAGLTLQVQ